MKFLSFKNKVSLNRRADYKEMDLQQDISTDVEYIPFNQLGFFKFKKTFSSTERDDKLIFGLVFRFFHNISNDSSRPGTEKEITILNNEYSLDDITRAFDECNKGIKNFINDMIIKIFDLEEVKQYCKNIVRNKE